MKGLSKTISFFCLFTFLSSKVEREAAEFSWQRERLALPYYPPSPVSLTSCPPSHCPLSLLAALVPLLAGCPPFSSARTDGDTPLIMAAMNGHTEVVAALLAGGANANQGKHPLFLSDLFHCAGSRPPMPPPMAGAGRLVAQLAPIPPPPRSNFGPSAPFLGRLGANGSLRP